MRLAQVTYNQSIRERTYSDFIKYGVIPDYEGIRANAWAEAFICPVCFKPVHPEMVDRHVQKNHPTIKPMPGLTIMICDIDDHVTRAGKKVIQMPQPEPEKYPLAVRGCTAVVPYGMFLTVA